MFSSGIRHELYNPHVYVTFFFVASRECVVVEWAGLRRAL